MIWPQISVAAALALALFVAPGLNVRITSGVLLAIWVAWFLYDALQTHTPVRRAYPILGSIRPLAYRMRPLLRQYFFEREPDKVPISRQDRQVIGALGSGRNDEASFGSISSVIPIRSGDTFLHSLYPTDPKGVDVSGIGLGCNDSSTCIPILNVGALGLGPLSERAISSLANAAASGGFLLNTGEDGLSQIHQSSSAGLIWQIGTGYFGCRTPSGDFDPVAFQAKSTLPCIKAIEIKLSQGAKPGLGGLLPGSKVTRRLARELGVVRGEDVASGPAHKRFGDARTLVEFINELNVLSGGKPIGIKYCFGREGELGELFKLVSGAEVSLDFVVVDCASGGTGAAPVAFMDGVGRRLRHGLEMTQKLLKENGLRNTRIIASGGITTPLSLARALALGADACYSARGFMMALGCVQARECHSDQCPSGVATHQWWRTRAIATSAATERALQYQAGMIRGLTEIVAALGLDSARQLGPQHLAKLKGLI